MSYKPMTISQAISILDKARSFEQISLNPPNPHLDEKTLDALMSLLERVELVVTAARELGK